MIYHFVPSAKKWWLRLPLMIKYSYNLATFTIGSSPGALKEFTNIYYILYT